MASLCFQFTHQLSQQSFAMKTHLKYTSSSRLIQLTPKMVNTRAKIQKIQNTMKLCILEAAKADSTTLASQSGALVGSNDKLLIEILIRLPVTSVLRFKSVSKHWRSLLSHPRFTLRYKNSPISSPGFFVRNLYIPFDDNNQSTPPFRKLDFYLDPCGIRIVQSCNGLLLCCSDRGHVRARKYYIFNPTTKQFALLPSVPGGTDVRKTIRFMGLAFHQTDCFHYKVVCIRCANPEQWLYKIQEQGLYKIQIYSSETGKWKISDQSFSVPYYTSFSAGVYLNQALYWAPSNVNPLYFKLDTEELKSLPLPMQVASFGGYVDGLMPLYFGESRGHLHLVEAVDRRVSCLHLNVYEMLNDNSGWSVKYRVELDEVPGAYPEMINSYLDPLSRWYYEFDFFDVIRGVGEDETFIVIKVPGKIIRYNVVDKSFKHIFNVSGTYNWRTGFSEVHRYIENLVCF